MKTAIVMVSIGHRPWAEKTARLFDVYARRVGADFVMQTSPATELADIEFPSFGRPNKLAYATKSYVAWKRLDDHDKVLVVDDTYVINPDRCENVFDLVPQGNLGIVEDPARKEKAAPESYLRSVEFIDQVYDGGWPHDHHQDRYMNSGFVIYDREHRDVFAPENIRRNSVLFGSDFPHQTFLYHAVVSHEIPTFRLPDAYHLVPGIDDLRYAERRRMKDIRKHVSPDDKCAHFTGSYRYRDRLIADTAALFSRTLSKEERPRRFGWNWFRWG